MCLAEKPFLVHTAGYLAAADVDYTSIEPTVLLFPSGSGDQAMQCIDINITDDSALENDEIFYVMLMAQEAYVSEGRTQLLVTIIDDDSKIDMLREK